MHFMHVIQKPSHWANALYGTPSVAFRESPRASALAHSALVFELFFAIRFPNPLPFNWLHQPLTLKLNAK